MHRANLADILHGRTKAPSLQTISKILDGLGYTLSIDMKSACCLYLNLRKNIFQNLYAEEMFRFI